LEREWRILGGLSVDETKVPPRKIKVVDRRKFTSDGDPRAESASPRSANTAGRSPDTAPDPPQPEAKQNRQEPPTPTSPDGMRHEPSSRFVELVAMLAGQAELLMTGAEGLPAQPAEAQRLIDYLGVLETKTAGNLSDEERQVFSNILYHVRSLFLQKSS
jgi:hypothetical protein